MEVMNTDKFEAPDRVNLGQSNAVFYPPDSVTVNGAGVVTSCVSDPENCGYVVISSYADCTSKDRPRMIRMNYRDFSRLFATVMKDEELKEKILKRAEKEMALELKRMKLNNCSTTTLLSAGRDFGLNEEDILLIIKGD